MTKTKASPAELDQQLADRYYLSGQLQAKRSSALDTALHMAGAKYFYRGRNRVTDMTEDQAIAILSANPSERNYSYSRTHEEALQAIEDADLAIDENIVATMKLEMLYTGWSRFFLVTSSIGHIHSSMNCSTCRPTTTFCWLPWLSDKSEADAIEVCGPALCTVCFPNAPVHYTTGSLTKKQAEQVLAGEKVQTREEVQAAKVAEKAAKAAEKLAKQLPRMMSLAAKVDELVTEFGLHPDRETATRAYNASWDTNICKGKFTKGYDNAYFVWSDMAKRTS